MAVGRGPKSSKHTIAAYGTAMIDIPSQVGYGGCKQIFHAIQTWQRRGLPFNNTGDEALEWGLTRFQLLVKS